MMRRYEMPKMRIHRTWNVIAPGYWLLAFSYHDLANSQKLSANRQQPTVEFFGHRFADVCYKGGLLHETG